MSMQNAGITPPYHSPSLTNAIFQRIIASIQPPTVPNKALECFALYWLIIGGTKAGTVITTAKLGQQTRLTPACLIALTERLEALGLITRERITASHGKGRAWAYHPVLPLDLVPLALIQEQDRLVRFASQRSAA